MSEITITRVDVTQNACRTFRELIELLKGVGFSVDHFHAVVRREVEFAEQIVELGPDGQFHFFEEEIFHLNLFWDTQDKVEEAGWDHGSPIPGFRDPLGAPPRGFYRLVADEWHGR